MLIDVAPCIRDDAPAGRVGHIVGEEPEADSGGIHDQKDERQPGHGGAGIRISPVHLLHQADQVPHDPRSNQLHSHQPQHRQYGHRHREDVRASIAGHKAYRLQGTQSPQP